MPSYCSVPNCKNRGGHLFPQDPALREKWVLAIGRTEYKREAAKTKGQPWRPSENGGNCVCPRHFKESDFVVKHVTAGTKPRRYLKPGTVPSVGVYGEVYEEDPIACENVVIKSTVIIKSTVCVICQIEFEDLGSLKLHHANVHDRSLKCNVCPYVAAKAAHLIVHVRNCHGDDKRKRVSSSSSFRCERCEFVASKVEGLKDHVNEIHKMVFACKRPPGAEAVINRKGLKHVTVVHRVTKGEKEEAVVRQVAPSSPSPFKCHLCFYTTHSESDLRTHSCDTSIRGISSAVKQYSNNVKRVEVVVVKANPVNLPKAEPEEEDGGDDIREEDFADELPLHHVKVLRTERVKEPAHPIKVDKVDKVDKVVEQEEYKCRKCDFATTIWDVLRLHSRNVHPRVECGRCAFTATSAKELRTHAKKVHPRLECDVCGFSTTWKSLLTTHVLTNHGVRTQEDDKQREDKVVTSTADATNANDNTTIKNNTNINTTEGAVTTSTNITTATATINITTIATTASNNTINNTIIDTTVPTQSPRLGSVKPTGRLTYRCRQCGYRASGSSSLTRHMTAADHKPRSFRRRTKRLLCDECGSAAGSLVEYKRHLESAHGRRNVRLRCNDCEDFAAETSADLGRHIRARHIEESRRREGYRCRVCDYSTGFDTDFAHVCCGRE